MTVEEAIKHAEEVAEENQRVVDTHVVFDDVTIDMLYCDDTEVIEEHLANCQRRVEEHRQLAEWLKDYKRLLEQTRLMKDWTKCSDDLPNMDVDVLGTIKDNGDVVKIARMETYCDDGGWEWVLTDDIEGNSYRPDEIIAWMPLPESYKADKE